VTHFAAVVFDMYGTLTPSWPKSYWDDQKRSCAAPLGIPADAWIEELDATWHERVCGHYGSVSETFRAVAARLGFSPTEAQLAAAVADRHSSYRGFQRLRPDALETLRTLRAAGFKLGLVSDCTAELPETWETLELAELFDAAVFSSHEQTRKPDPRLFRAVAERLGVAPEQCLYVGDGGGDELAGSAAVGMLPVLLAGADWADNHAPGRPEREWSGLRAATLSEIPGILAARTAS
jgi:putative hydrolase of the HAD superfamily